MNTLVHHFAGMKLKAQQLVKYFYATVVKAKINSDKLTEFNDNVTLVYGSTDNYPFSKTLLKYINENNINSINIYENVNRALNIEKILYFKKVLDEKYDLLNDYILFIDSGDTVLNVDISFNEILERFNSYNCNVLFNKDEYDYPFFFKIHCPTEKSPGYVKEYFEIPNIESLSDIKDKHFINSGVYFGKKEDIKELIDVCFKIIITDNNPKYYSDQFIFKKAAKFINEKYNKHFVEVDYKNKLFSCRTFKF
jgi:hypothetical protein